MADIDYIKLRPDTFGWTLIVYTEQGVAEYGIGDVIQFTEEVDRTLGRWLADGPADFHASTPYDQEEDQNHGR